MAESVHGGFAGIVVLFSSENSLLLLIRVGGFELWCLSVCLGEISFSPKGNMENG